MLDLTRPIETREIADELRRLFEELDQAGRVSRPLAGECSPELDVFETADAFEIAIDLPGVDIAAVRVLLKRDILIVAGEKAADDRRAPEGAVFHLVERSFGRFARAVRLAGAIDGSRSRATLADGELRILLPKIAERRGRDIVITIEKG